MRAKEAVKRLLMRLGYDLVPSHTIAMDNRQMTNLLYFARMYEHIGSLDGAIVECGVGKGRSILHLGFLAATENRGRLVWGFDSFEGFPAPSEYDRSPRNPRRGEWAGTSVEDIFLVLKRAGLPIPFIKERVRLVKGFLDTSLSKYDRQPIALLHLDVDLYESYRVSLEQLFPLIAKGGLLLFDEYKEPLWPGATRAIDQYLTPLGYTPLLDQTSGKYYVVKRA